MSSTTIEWKDPYVERGPPKFIPISPNPPPVTEDGRRYFENKLFAIIPNDKEKERIGKGVGLDLMNGLENFIKERAGGKLVSIEKATFILTRHPDITSFATTLEPSLAKKLIHFDWILDTLCSRSMQSREGYWGIPRNQTKSFIDCSYNGSPNYSKLPRDPRKSYTLSSSHSTKPHPPALSINCQPGLGSGSRGRYTLSPISAASSFSSFDKTAELPTPQRYFSEAYQPRPKVKESNTLHSNRRATYDYQSRRLPFITTDIFRGEKLFVIGPVNARFNLEYKFTGGELAPSREEATKIIFVDPKFQKDKSWSFSSMKYAISHGVPAVAEGWIHDCYSTGVKRAIGPYQIKIDDYENGEIWERTKNEKLLKFSDVDLQEKIQVQVREEKIELEKRRNSASRFYATPVSPDPVPLHMEGSRMCINIRKESAPSADHLPAPPSNAMLEVAFCKNVQSDSDNCLIIEDDDLDICCTDPEDESVYGDVEADNLSGLAGKTFLNFQRKRASVTISQASSPLTSISDLEEDETVTSKTHNHASQADTLKKETKRERPTPLKDNPDCANTKRKKYTYEPESSVRPKDQDTFDMLMGILVTFYGTGGSPPQGGISRYVQANGFRTIYRRYRTLYGEAIPNLPGSSKDKAPRDIAGKFKQVRGNTT